MSVKHDAKMTDPNVLAAVACLGGFWFFLHRATDKNGKDQPKWIRWATWW